MEIKISGLLESAKKGGTAQNLNRGRARVEHSEKIY